MVGRLAEISPWLNFEKSSWADKQGRGHFGWEEMPYWLKGYGDLGYVLKDKAVIAEARKWIEAAMDSQRDDGWFGPRESLTSLGGKPDLWPHMLMLNILQSYHEATGDPRAIEVMTRFMKWENTLPDTAFGEGYWPKLRAGDNIESALWLYNRTGEPWLLDLARKIHRGMARWDRDVIDWHNVNLAQGFRAGTVFGVLSQGGPRPAIGRAELPDRDGALRAAARRRVRGRRELPARVPRSAGRHRDLRDRRVHAQFRDAHADHRPAVVGRPLRGDRA